MNEKEYRKEHGIPINSLTVLKELLPRVNGGDIYAAEGYIKLVASMTYPPTNFDVRLDRPVLIDLMRQRIIPKSWEIMCKEYCDSQKRDDIENALHTDDWVGMDYDDFPIDEEVEDIPSDWETFEIWLPEQFKTLSMKKDDPLKDPGTVRIKCSICEYEGWMLGDREMCPECLDTVGIEYIDHPGDAYETKLENWKSSTKELVESFAVGHQFIGFILACIDDVEKEDLAKKEIWKNYKES